MADETPDGLLALSERELEESIASLNDLFDQNFLYLLPRPADNPNASPPQSVDPSKLVLVSDEEQSQITTKLAEILPKLSKLRRVLASLSSVTPLHNFTDPRGGAANMSNMDELFVQADDAFYGVPTRTPNSSILSPGLVPSAAERSFTSLMRRASEAFQTFEKSAYNDETSRKQFATLIKSANKSMQSLQEESKEIVHRVSLADASVSEANQSNVSAMFEEFDSLMQQADVMFDTSGQTSTAISASVSKTADDEKGSNDDAAKGADGGKGKKKTSFKGVGRSLAIINEQLRKVAQENEKLIKQQEQEQSNTAAKDVKDAKGGNASKKGKKTSKK